MLGLETPLESASSMSLPELLEQFNKYIIVEESDLTFKAKILEVQRNQFIKVQ